MPELNYATQYSQALAQAYPYVLHFAALRSTDNDGRYKWVDGNTIKIPILTTTGRVDGDRDSIAAAKRNFDNSWETKTLGNHRQWSTLVHPMDIDETNRVASIQNITKVFNEEQKFPEMDVYLVSKVYADWTALGNAADTEALTEQNILQKFDAYMLGMDEANVPKTGRLLYLTPAVEKIFKNAEKLARQISNGDEHIRRLIKSLDEVTIESVPSALMKTVYDFTEGWKAVAGAKQINMMLAHPSAVITPEKYAFAQLDNPCALTNGKYYYFEESYDDTFVLEKRAAAIQFNIEG